MLLSVSDLFKSYRGAEGAIPVINGVSFGVSKAETLALTGESGSGKSTLLHLIGGLDLPDSGVISVDGADVTRLDDKGRANWRRTVTGVVFQQFNLIPSLDVADNIALQARMAGRQDRDWTAFLSDRLGLRDHLHKYPESLSGGQQQRVAIARALAVRPKLVLADEPTGNLDEATADKVLAEFLNLVRHEGSAALVATHNERLAARMDRVVRLREGQLI